MDDESRVRKQLNVRVPVVAKEQLIRVTAFRDRSITNYVEMYAAYCEARVLRDLSEKDRARYLAMEIRRLPPKKPDTRGPTVVTWTTLSMQLTIKAKRQLRRYANYRGRSISGELAHFAASAEQFITKNMTDEQRAAYMAGTLDRALFFPDMADDDATQPGEAA